MYTTRPDPAAVALLRGLLVVVSLYAVAGGVWLALATPPLSGGTIAAVLLITAGGGLIARIRQVQTRAGA